MFRDVAVPPVAVREAVHATPCKKARVEDGDNVYDIQLYKIKRGMACRVFEQVIARSGSTYKVLFDFDETLAKATDLASGKQRIRPCAMVCGMATRLADSTQCLGLSCCTAREHSAFHQEELSRVCTLFTGTEMRIDMMPADDDDQSAFKTACAESFRAEEPASDCIMRVGNLWTDVLSPAEIRALDLEREQSAHRSGDGTLSCLVLRSNGCHGLRVCGLDAECIAEIDFNLEEQAQEQAQAQKEEAQEQEGDAPLAGGA